MPTLEDRIIHHLQTADGATVEDIADSVGAESERVESTLENLRDSGEVDYYRSGYPLQWAIVNS